MTNCLYTIQTTFSLNSWKNVNKLLNDQLVFNDSSKQDLCCCFAITSRTKIQLASQLNDRGELPLEAEIHSPRREIVT